MEQMRQRNTQAKILSRILRAENPILDPEKKKNRKK